MRIRTLFLALGIGSSFYFSDLYLLKAQTTKAVGWENKDCRIEQSANPSLLYGLLHLRATKDLIIGINYQGKLVKKSHIPTLTNTINTGIKPCKQLAISPDSRYIAAVDNEIIKVWNTEDLSLINEINPFTRKITDIVFSTDSKQLLVTGVGSSGQSIYNTSGRLQNANNVVFVDVLTGLRKDSIIFNNTDGNYIRRACYNINNDLFAISDSRNFIYIYERKSMKLINTLFEGKKELSYDVEDLRNVTITKLVFDNKNKRIITSNNIGQIHIWDITLGIMVDSLKGHSGMITDFSIDKQDKYLVSASEDGTIRIWDIQTSKLIRVLEPNKYEHNSNSDGFKTCALSDDGLTIVSGQNYICTWSLKPPLKPSPQKRK